MMGGDVTLVSDPDRGSIFTLTFMAEISQAVSRETLLHKLQPAQATQSDTDKSANPGKRMLVVDDNAINRRVARTFLEQQGYEVDEAVNGIQALEKLEESPFNLVLMDIHMPELDGQRAFDQLRAGSGPNAAVPVIALTADSMRGDQEKYIARGFNGYVSKPIDQRSLLTMVEECLAGASTQDDRRRKA